MKLSGRTDRLNFLSYDMGVVENEKNRGWGYTDTDILLSFFSENKKRLMRSPCYLSVSEYPSVLIHLSVYAP
jgi:hypothetical protein